MPVTAAYNFVPLTTSASDIFVPEWQDRVSHDHPFEGGLCAEFDIVVTAHTPLLVGADRQKGQPVPFFTHPDGTPALPGSALRGMVRNVLEIASFARLQLVDDKALSQRDLFLRRYTREFVDRDRDNNLRAKSKGGWLRFNAAAGVWQIEEQDVLRIEASALTARLPTAPGTPPQTLFDAIDAALVAANKDDQVLARTKYRAIAGCVDHHVRTLNGSPPHRIKRGGQTFTLHYEKVEIDGRRAAGSRLAHLVLTGQPNKTKHMEFFFAPASSSKTWDVSAAVMRSFKQIHAKSKDLEFLEDAASPHAARGIPVFFLHTQNGEVSHLGIAQMFRLPGKKTIAGMAGHHHRPHSDRRDFVETLFGYVDGTRALKSRVTFSDARLVGPAVKAGPAFLGPTVLASPKATFYPAYLDQTTRGPGGRLISALGDSVNENGGEVLIEPRLRGWKRYPVRLPMQVTGVAPPPELASPETKSFLQPLAQGQFRGRVRLHNVMPQELGGVLWSLLWGGDGTNRHSIGMGKAFGMGQVSVTASGLDVRYNNSTAAAPSTDPAHWMALFVAGMNMHKRDWIHTPQMRQLLAMANPAHPKSAAARHMEFRMAPQSNPFADCKRLSEELPDYDNFEQGVARR